MSVRVQLDLPHGDIYTNLDFVTGRVLLTLPTDATVSAITVKLEGESRTRLEGPRSLPGSYDDDKKKTLLEVHKLLYKVETVFPTPELRQPGPYRTNRTSQYTLLRGQYEYPFKFKMPFNSDCVSNTSIIKDLKVGQLSVQYGQEPLHAKLPLPPSLAGYPGEADIRYFVKATVVRPKFYHENLRNEISITFLPIEPPRATATEGEIYGRRKHQFQRTNTGNSIPRKSLFKSSKPDPVPDEEPLAFQVDARLPNPAIITCREPLPLRILVERLNQSTMSIFLSMLQIELIGHTEIRAYDLQRKESHPWLLVSMANMSIPLEHPSNKIDNWTIPSQLWDKIRLPPTVPPTFKTCNISRKYELEVRIGLTHAMATGMRPEIIVSPIRLDVEVYSGIRPPPQLLDAMAQQAQSQQSRTDSMNSIPKLDTKQDTHIQQSYLTPATPQSHWSPISMPLPPGADHTPSTPAAVAGIPHTTNDDLPPSYEDAIANDLAPVDGPRPSGYTANGAPSPQAPAFNPDSKSGLARRVSERLFSSNAPGSGRSSKFASGDMSRFGGDVVPEESAAHIDADLVEASSRLTITNESGSTSDVPEYKPPLPVRRTTEQQYQQAQQPQYTSGTEKP
ncbi:hypothetical protein LTR64_008392 [Lithohypha guttulata]|uniref:uncharacterized protein n=1 Tax=Lithohypha guttulata TaxID=1690604 RepID=UPI002DE15F8B|nr:hypothetical protein LTR51_008562 [Lithohypha guttulata]